MENKERKKDAWRDCHVPIQIGVPMKTELKAEAEVRGLTIGEVIELHLDAYRHLMMLPGELIAHIKKDHPELVHDYEPGSPEDMAASEEFYDAQMDFHRRIQEVMEKNQRGMLIHKAIARSKAIEKERTERKERAEGVGRTPPLSTPP